MTAAPPRAPWKEFSAQTDPDRPATVVLYRLDANGDPIGEPLMSLPILHRAPSVAMCREAADMWAKRRDEAAEILADLTDRAALWLAFADAVETLAVEPETVEEVVA